MFLSSIIIPARGYLVIAFSSQFLDKEDESVAPLDDSNVEVDRTPRHPLKHGPPAPGAVLVPQPRYLRPPPDTLLLLEDAVAAGPVVALNHDDGWA